MPKGIPKNGTNKGWFKKGVSTQQGMRHSEKTKENIRQKLLGRIPSEETRRKISKIAKEKGFLIGWTKRSNFEEVRKKMSLAQLGEKSKNWKGDKIDYKGLHVWVRNRLGNPELCLECKKHGKKTNGRWNIHWANKDHIYSRNLEDWIPLCPRCHVQHDKKLRMYASKIINT